MVRAQVRDQVHDRGYAAEAVGLRELEVHMDHSVGEVLPALNQKVAVAQRTEALLTWGEVAHFAEGIPRD